MKKLFPLLLIFVFYLGTKAQTAGGKEKHVIDRQLENCHALDSNQTTAGMMHCELVASIAWDKEMNHYYKLLTDTLPADAGTKLKLAQLAWLNYRDKELAFSSTLRDKMQGSMWSVAAAVRSCAIIRMRALELKEYYDTYLYK